VPSAAPRTVGIETAAAVEHKKMIEAFGGEYKAPTAERYLNEILVKLAQASEHPGEAYKVTILNSPVVNAFALPSGNLYVTRGMLALANDTAEVAAVMAHEIAHVTARHALQRAEQEKRAAVISQAASVIQSRQKGEEVEATAKQTIASFSRQQEFEADRIGVNVIARAGYDPYGASRFLASLERSTALRASLLGQPSGGSKPDILATHPATPERTANALKVARQIGAPGIGVSNRAAYLASIDGMMFGDDPGEGSIRGRKFIHPKLGFAFLAPEGFFLENLSQAILGIKSGGNEALRLDNVRLAQTSSLESYLSSGWIDGLMQSSIEAREINGMPAVLATARAGEWNFRLAVIRFDAANVYRLIFAARTLTEDVDKRFIASIGSFQRISPDEAAAIHPLRIQVASAQADDTAENLARKMIVPDRPLEHFLLLNGLEKGGPLQAGERYKLVTE
jgi:predicted Zn-dependent protease